MFKIIGGDGEEYGPVDNATVRQWIQEGRASAQTMLKREGQAAWAPLSAYPEFASLLGSGSGGQPTPGSVGQPIPKGTVPNYLIHSILLAVCCCLPFGIAAILKATKVDTHLGRGDRAAAISASENAKKWCIWGLVLGIITNVIIGALQVMAETM